MEGVRFRARTQSVAKHMDLSPGTDTYQLSEFRAVTKLSGPPLPHLEPGCRQDPPPLPALLSVLDYHGHFLYVNSIGFCPPTPFISRSCV